MSLIDKLKGVFGAGETVVPREPVSYKPIGVVRNRVRESTTQGWQDVRSEIILRGTVKSWAERQEAERAAWAAPGVTKVDNRVTISV